MLAHHAPVPVQDRLHALYLYSAPVPGYYRSQPVTPNGILDLSVTSVLVFNMIQLANLDNVQTDSQRWTSTLDKSGVPFYKIITSSFSLSATRPSQTRYGLT